MSTTRTDPNAGWKAAARDADQTLWLAEDVPMFFRRIPRGEFVMGSRSEIFREQPRHRGAIPEDFLLGTFPVTQEQFRVWTAVEKVEHENGFAGDRLPAESMDWNTAMAFCGWLGRRCAAELDGFVATLPPEAYWEHACRAGSTSEYWSGDGEGALEQVGWFEGNSDNCTHVVGELGSAGANPWGLFDMHGNVDEWCLDEWAPNAYRGRVDGDDAVVPVVDPEDRRANRVIRGGSWFGSAGGCRSAYRFGRRPGGRDGGLGFRVALLPGSVVPQAERGAPQATRAEAPEDGDGGGGTPPREPSPGAGAARRPITFDDLELPDRPAPPHDR